jgi:mannose-6-phosphate isomerase
MKLVPFRTEPFFHARPWGGRAMETGLGKKIPPGAVAEAWEVSAHPNGVCRVSGGQLSGTGLDELTRQAGPALLGRAVHEKYSGEFPVLIKLIDVNALASVQVHPDDAQARRLEGFPRGKTEAWYIISRAPDARFSLGLVPGVNRESFRDALSRGKAQELLGTPEVEAGDCLFVPPGTVHAAGNGVLLLEVQQSCDLTYRVYDWDRVDDQGRKRELHVDKAMQVIDFTSRPRIYRADAAPGRLNRILSCDHFEMFEARLAGAVMLPEHPACSAGTLLRGAAVLTAEDTRLDLRCGDSFVIPAGCGACLQGAAGAAETLAVITLVR